MFGRLRLRGLQAKESRFRQIGDFDSALSVLNDILAIDANFSPALNNKAAILMMQGQYCRALPVARAAVTADPHNGQALNNLGYCLVKTGNPDEAVVQLHGALDAGYKHEGVRYNLGLAYLGLGNIEDGLDEWQRVLRANPANMSVLQDLYKLAQAVGVLTPGQADIHESAVPLIKAALEDFELRTQISESGGEMMFMAVRKQ